MIRKGGLSGSGRARRRFLYLFGAALLGTAGALAATPRCRTIYLGGHARHAGLIVARSDFDPVGSIGAEEFLTKDWLEFGWGDADFYQGKDDNLLTGMKALFLPTGTVMHVHGFNGSPGANFPQAEMVDLRLPEEGYARLLAFLRASFARDSAGNALPRGPGLYGLSRFYEGTGTYSLFNTCNTWAARALATGNFPIDPNEVGTVDQLMERVRGKTFAACPASGQ